MRAPAWRRLSAEYFLYWYKSTCITGTKVIALLHLAQLSVVVLLLELRDFERELVFDSALNVLDFRGVVQQHGLGVLRMRLRQYLYFCASKPRKFSAPAH